MTPGDRSEGRPPIPEWTTRLAPLRTPMEGRISRAEPLSRLRHEAVLCEAFRGAETNWLYVPDDPPVDLAAWRSRMEPDEHSMSSAIGDSRGSAVAWTERRGVRRSGSASRSKGVYGQAVVYKGRSRDTAWVAIIDRDWPWIKAGCERWLDAANFDPAGHQRRTLAECRDGDA